MRSGWKENAPMKTASRAKYLGRPALSWQVRDDLKTDWLGDLVDLIKEYWGPNLRKIKINGDQVTFTALNAGGREPTFTLKANEDTGMIQVLVTQEGRSARQDFLPSQDLGQIVEGLDLAAMSLLPKGWQTKWSAKRVARRFQAAGISVGDMVSWNGKRVMVVDVHGYPPKTVDLRWTESGTAGSRDEVSGHKRGVPVSQISKG
jgi:hypothetical protein